jgi:hypothetical protein
MSVIRQASQSNQSQTCQGWLCHLQWSQTPNNQQSCYLVPCSHGRKAHTVFLNNTWGFYSSSGKLSCIFKIPLSLKGKIQTPRFWLSNDQVQLFFNSFLPYEWWHFDLELYFFLLIKNSQLFVQKTCHLLNKKKIEVGCKQSGHSPLWCASSLGHCQVCELDSPSRPRFLLRADLSEKYHHRLITEETLNDNNFPVTFFFWLLVPLLNYTTKLDSSENTPSILVLTKL